MAIKATVTFQPEGKRARVRQGTSVLEAAKEASVAVRSECGGQGTCGKCRVIMEKTGTTSQVTEAERNMLSRREIKSGYRLACQAKVLRATCIMLPHETRITARKIQTEGFEKQVKLYPSTRKLFVELQKPTLTDAKPDLERLLNSLNKIVPKTNKLRIDLDLMRKLPDVLRHSNWRVTITVWNDEEVIAVEKGDTRKACYGLAIDIGTSKIVGHLVDLTTGNTVSIASVENPQILHGEDIMTRIAYASESKANLNEMQKLAAKGINEVLKKACDAAGVNEANVYESAVVGNTAMHHMFLGVDPHHLALSPFTPAVKGLLNIRGKELNIKMNPNAKVTSLPIIAGFVGADAIADLIATDIHENNDLSMLVDIGTNTEIFLGNKDDILCCSCASGPAFEGAHIKHGIRATTGAIERLKIRQPNFRVEYETIDKAKPTGICGSAMVDIVAELLRHGIIDKHGRFLKESKTDRIRRSGKETEFTIASENETANGREITVSQRDIGEIQLAKAAIYAGSMVLLKEKKLSEAKLDRILVAGAFGNYLNVENAKYIRMTPNVPTDIISFIGNAAIAGAKIALKSKRILKSTTALFGKVRYLELAAHRDFNRQFIESLCLA